LKELLPGKENEIAKAIAATDDSTPPAFDYIESDLHPFLAYYSRVYLKAFTKTIRHNTSSKRVFGEWVHPDMIGVYFAAEDWKPEILDLSAATGNLAVVKGDDVFDERGGKIATLSEIRSSIDNAIGGAIMVALWLAFIR
jgi:hypothetical protein